MRVQVKEWQLQAQFESSSYAIICAREAKLIVALADELGELPVTPSFFDRREEARTLEPRRQAPRPRRRNACRPPAAWASSRRGARPS